MLPCECFFLHIATTAQGFSQYQHPQASIVVRNNERKVRQHYISLLVVTSNEVTNGTQYWCLHRHVRMVQQCNLNHVSIIFETLVIGEHTTLCKHPDCNTASIRSFGPSDKYDKAQQASVNTSESVLDRMCARTGIQGFTYYHQSYITNAINNIQHPSWVEVSRDTNWT